MADATVLKTVVRKGVPVRVRQGAPDFAVVGEWHSQQAENLRLERGPVSSSLTSRTNLRSISIAWPNTSDCQSEDHGFKSRMLRQI